MLERSRAIELNVSALEPPEPLLQIFKSLATLPPDHHLDVIHRREPFPLYEMLDLTGYHHCCEQRRNDYLIQIWPGECADPARLSQLVDNAPPCT